MMKNKSRSLSCLNGDRSGGIAVEFALVTPVLLIFLAGVVDLGRAGYALTSLRSAARAGAEYVQRTGILTGADLVAIQAANLPLADGNVEVGFFCECSGTTPATCGTICNDGNGAAQFISVEIEQAFATLLPYPFLSAAPRLQGRSVLRVK